MHAPAHIVPRLKTVPGPRLPPAPPLHDPVPPPARALHLRSLLEVSVLALAAILLRALIIPWASHGTPFIFSFPVVVLCTWRWGLTAGLVSVGITVGAAHIILHHSIALAGGAHLATALLFGMLGSLTAYLTDNFYQLWQSRRALTDRLSAILGGIDEAVVCLDSQNRVEFVNDRAAALTNAPHPEGVPVLQLLEFAPNGSKTHGGLGGLLDAVREHKGRSSLTGRLVPMGTETRPSVPVHVAVTPLVQDGAWAGTVLVVRDLTAQELAHAQLAESEQRFRTIADSAPVFIWMADPTGACTFFNKPWLEFTGRTADQEAGEGWIEGVHPDDRPALLALYRNALAAKTEFSVEYRLRRHDGVYRWVLDRGRPRFDPHNEFAGFIGSCFDITEIHEARDHLLQARDAAEQSANQLEQAVHDRTSALRAAVQDMEHFVSSVAHDFRSPLSAIHRYAQILEEDFKMCLSDEGATKLRRMSVAAARLIQMVDNLLAYSRLNRADITLEPLNLATLLDNLREGHLEWREAEIEIVEPLRLVRGNATALEQTLSNLISNGIKFVEPGRIPHLRIWTESSPNAVSLFIEDNGIGIPPEDRPTLFKLFSRGSMARPFPGSGLGLATARRAMDRMGGAIDYAPAPGGGTRFELRFPV